MSVTDVSSGHGLLYPLTIFRKRDRRPLPVVEHLEGNALPEPYRTLLYHEGDMTSRLEHHHASPIVIRALHIDAQPALYRREVLLCTEGAGLPVEYGAIEIRLDGFSDELRAEVMEAKLPFGGLLNKHGIEYRSQPRGFFRVLPDLTLCRLFGVDAASSYYGRANRIVGPGRRTLARIVEVLRP